MSKNAEIIKGYVGSWAPLIGGEFTKPYMATLNGHVNTRKLEEEVNGSPFECFKRVEMTHVKVLIIVNDLSAMGEEEWFCHEQGIMYFPRRMTWGTTPHCEWHIFSETVLLMILQYKVLVICDIPVMTTLINTMSPNTIVMNKPDWALITEYVADEKVIIPF